RRAHGPDAATRVARLGARGPRRRGFFQQPAREAPRRPPLLAHGRARSEGRHVYADRGMAYGPRMSDDLAWLDASAQAELVRRGKASPAELVEAAIRRTERTNPELNAVSNPRFAKARAEAGSRALPDGPFRGVPFLLKDLICSSAGD